MNIKHPYFLFSILILSLFFPGCPDDGVQPTPNPLQFIVEDVTCTEAFLKISLAPNETNRTITLKRSDSTIATITMAGNDTLFIDEGLLPKRTYTYKLAHNEWNVTAQATTQDTTSHEIQWQIPDTLGVEGLIRDVWAFSRDNAWAVGEFYIRDTTENINYEIRYNAAHWDGTRWGPQQIPYYYQGQPVFNPIYCIYAFSANDIWFAGNGVIHWDGQQYIPAEIPASIWGAFLVHKIWGTSSNNVFIIGDGGRIAHYTNGSWTKMESHTTVNLQDIWGIDNTHIWATGTNIGDGQSVVLQYDGKQWMSIYDSNTQLGETKYQFVTLWTNSPSRIFLDGGSWLRTMDLKNYNISQPINTGRTYVSYRLRSTSRLDIFDTGQASEVAHFNGISWYLYPELKAINDGFAWFYSVHPTKDFILIGGVRLTALNGVPVVIRGYR